MTMKGTGFVLTLFALLCLASCGNKPAAPDVSAIKFQIETKRFDQDLFRIDTLRLDEEMNALQQKYPQLLGIFLQNILGINEPEGLKAWLRNYRPVYDSAQQVFGDMAGIQKELEQACRYIRHYYPDYELPQQMVPVLGPLDTRDDLARMSSGELTPNFLGDGFVGVSLQFYMGANYSLYNTEYFVTNVAPLFRSRRFAKEYLVPDLMRLMVDDLYPDRSFTQSLVDQMIEKGKRWWLIGKFMPQAADSVITGYTQAQLDWTQANEGMIWSYIVKNERLDSKEPATIQTYIGEAPFTIGMPQEYSPGNLGPWLGRQIVRAFEENNPELSTDEIMKTPAEKILEGAKYKPK
jgi:hypothetical protein